MREVLSEKLYLFFTLICRRLMEKDMDIVYFVYAKHENCDKDIPSGVWTAGEGSVQNICSSFKKGGGWETRSQTGLMAVSQYGKCESIRLVERIWIEPVDGSSPVVISDKVYNQRDMRRLARQDIQL